MLFWDAVIFLKTLKMCYVTLKLKSQLIEKSEHFILKFWRKPFNFSGKKKNTTFFSWDCSLASTRQWNGFYVFLWFLSYSFNAFSIQINQIPSLKAKAVRPAQHKIGSELGTGLELSISLLCPSCTLQIHVSSFLFLHLLREKENSDVLILCTVK